MAQAGEKRSIEKDDVSGGEEYGPKAAKRMTFAFRPSTLKPVGAAHSTATSSSSAMGKKGGEGDGDSGGECGSGDGQSATGTGSGEAPPVVSGGFLKLDSSDIRPISIGMPTIMVDDRLTDGASHGGKKNSGFNSAAEALASNSNNSKTPHENPFLQFLSNSCSSFSSLTSNSPTFGQATTSTNTPSDIESERQDGVESSAAAVDTSPHGNATAMGGQSPLQIGLQPATALLPEVQMITGEEGEKNIVQVPCRLYLFDSTNHSWKDRGRGVIHLNDSCKEAGVFQSRLVMRASGSYRLMLNTHLWAEMKCARSSQKTIRITAQGSDDGLISVFVIMGVTKDIQQLFTAIDRRLEALKRNVDKSAKKKKEEEEGRETGGATSLTLAGTPGSSTIAQLQDEEDRYSFLDDPVSSPESSPDTSRHRQAIRHQQPVVKISSSTGQPIYGSGSGGGDDSEREREREMGGEEESCGSGSPPPGAGMGMGAGSGGGAGPGEKIESPRQPPFQKVSFSSSSSGFPSSSSPTPSLSSSRSSYPKSTTPATTPSPCYPSPDPAEHKDATAG